MQLPKHIFSGGQKRTQAGFAHILVLLLILTALPLGLWALQKQQELRSKASISPLTAPCTGLDCQQTGFGKALKLNGTDAYLDVQTNTLNSTYQINSPITIEGWIKPERDNYSIREIRVLASHMRYKLLSGNCYSGIDWNNRYPSTLDPSTSYNTAFLYNTQSASPHLQDTEKLVYGSWMHVAITVDSSNVAKLYVNGKLKSTGTISGTFSDAACGGRPFSIGARYDEETIPHVSNTTLFKGEMDEFRLSNIVRYASEFSTPIAPFTTDANTIALWHFDGNAIDSSQNSLNTTSVGSVQFVDSTVNKPQTPTPTEPETYREDPSVLVRVNNCENVVSVNGLSEANT